MALVDMEKFLVAAATAFIGLLFLIGYLYLYGYYNYFGVGMNELRFSVQDVLVHSFASLRYSLSSKWLLLFVIIFLVACVALVQTEKIVFDFEQVSVGVSIAILATLIGFSFSAESYGERNAMLDSGSRPIVVGDSAVVEATLQIFEGREIWLRHLRTGDTLSHYIVQLKDGGTDRWLVRLSDARIQSVVYLGH